MDSDSIGHKPENEAPPTGADNQAAGQADVAASSPSGAGPVASQRPAAPSDPDPPAQAASAAGELEPLRAERDKLRDQLLRTAADFDNFRKRTKRDLDEAKQRGKDDLIRDLLPVFDNLERALQTAGGASALSSVVEGVRMVLKLFEDTAERLGLVRVPCVGERFDPAVHEAIQQKETAEHPAGTVVAEVVPGYRFGDRLVRPAMVVVARKPAEAAPAKVSQAPSAPSPTDGGVESGSNGVGTSGGEKPE
jgi:molecular chaperone GrpE